MFVYTCRWALCVCLFLTLCLNGLQAQKWTPKDIIHTEYAGSVKISQDNSKLLWSKRRAVKEKDKFVNDLYVTYLNEEHDGKPLTVQLTRSDDSDYNASFGPNGTSVYFLSGRKEGKKLWKLSLHGGEAEEVHAFDQSISSLQWLNDSTLAFISSEGKTQYERDLKEKKDDTQVVEDTVYWTRNQVFTFDLKEKEVDMITNFDYPVSSLTTSHDGLWAITSLRMSPHYPADAQPKTQYYLHDLAQGTKTRILQGLQTPGGFNFDLDNAGFYFTAELSSDPEWNGAGINELYYFSIEKQNFDKINIDWPLGVSSSPYPTTNGVLIGLANKATYGLAHYTNSDDGWTKHTPDLGKMQDHTRVLAISLDGTHIAYRYSTASQLPEYYFSALETDTDGTTLGENIEWVRLNDDLKKKPKARTEVYEWVGAMSDTVTGILYYPIDYEDGRRYPIMLSIHGGPAGVDTDTWSERWSTYPNLIAEKNAFVLKPNYHGSANHGQAFVESIKGHYYDLEMVDIMNGIRSLAAEGKVDTTEMGVMGWSNGAILATMLTVRYPDHFKVATPGAGDVNWTSDYGTCRFGVSFDQSYFGGAPWDNVNGLNYNPAYIEKSPLFELEKVKTPTMIFHGSADRAVPRDQGWEYYRALQQIGAAPVRFLWFPNQPHGLQKISHQMRKMEEEIKWIDTYLFEQDTDDNVAVDDDSPLAMLTKRSNLMRSSEGYFGIEDDGALLPQVASVAEDSIDIGILEVTNAQYASLMSHTYASTDANKPVRGLDKNDINAYLKALSTHTGDVYRLPNEEESEALQKKAKGVAKKENTLNHWAGYAPTSRETALLHKKLHEIDADLIMQAASFDPISLGEAEIYDLGGNVAEYSQSGHYGYSAYQVPGNQAGEPKSEHMGLRVVRGLK